MSIRSQTAPTVRTEQPGFDEAASRLQECLADSVDRAGSGGGALWPRVLFITGEYPPAIGGVGDYTACLASALARAGGTASVLTGRGPATGTESGVRREVTTWGRGCWRTVERAIVAECPDLVHIQYQAGAFGGQGAIPLLPWRLARRHRGLPVLVTFHDLQAPYLFPKAGPLRPRALRLLAHGCAATIVTNGEDYATLHGDPRLARRLRLIPIGSNIPPLPERGRAEAVATIRATLGLRPRDVIVAYFGLAGSGKGLDTLLAAYRRMASTGHQRLLIIGGEASTTDRPYFTDGNDLAGAVRAAGLSEQVTITGALSIEQVARHLATVDLMVLPYHDGASWRRGSLLAALAASVPVVTTTPHPAYRAAGRLPELVDGENVLLVPPDDPVALATAIARLAHDEGLRRRLAAAGVVTAAACSWEAIATAHLALYRMLLTRPVRETRAGGRR